MNNIIDDNTKLIFESFRKMREKRFCLWEEEETQSDGQLSRDSDTFTTVESEMRELLESTLLYINYIMVTKQGAHNKIELSGTIQNTLTFRFEYGNENGFYITADNFQLNDEYVESLRKLNIYYQKSFATFCKKLLETT